MSATSLAPVSLAAAIGRAPAPVPMMVFIVGKVEAVRRYENKTYTRVVCPAPDLYSKPSVVEIRSAGRLGQKDDEVQCSCRLAGYTRKPYRVTDRETGEQSTITPVDHTLDLVE